MISAFFVLSQNGDVLISRLFRESVKRNVSEVFRVQVIYKHTDLKNPILTLGSTSFLHIKHGNIWFVATTRNNIDASVVLQFLSDFILFLQSLILPSFSLPSSSLPSSSLPSSSLPSSSLPSSSSSPAQYLTSTDVMNNFMLIYELLNLSIDQGYIQLLDPSIILPNLSSLVVKSSLDSSPPHILRRCFLSNVEPKLGSDYIRTQKNPEAHYEINEITFSILEELTLLMGKTGNIIQAVIDGSIHVTSKLSGSPKCTFQIENLENLESHNSYNYYSKDSNDYIYFDDDYKYDAELDSCQASLNKVRACTFHPSVDIRKFKRENVISFTPVDGKFKVLEYHTDMEREDLPLLVYADYKPIIETQFELKVILKSQYPGNISANNAWIKIPVPEGTTETKISSDIGETQFLPHENLILWNLKKFDGMTVCKLKAVVTIANDTVHTLPRWNVSRPPVSMGFVLPNYAVTNCKVIFFDVEETSLNYRALKSIIYSSKQKSYEFIS